MKPIIQCSAYVKEALKDFFFHPVKTVNTLQIRGQNAQTSDSSVSLSLPGNLLGTIVIKTTKASGIALFCKREKEPNLEKGRKSN